MHPVHAMCLVVKGLEVGGGVNLKITELGPTAGSLGLLIQVAPLTEFKCGKKGGGILFLSNYY